MPHVKEGVNMGLSVEKIGLFCKPDVKRKNNFNKTNSISNIGQNRETNLNNSPNNIAFQGWFFNRNQTAKKPSLKPEPPCLYGPYGLTKGVLNENDEIAYELLEPIAECLTRNNPENLERFSYDTSRATDKAISAMVPVCISTLACYQQTQTIFPEFHDSIARSFPKACSRLDKEKGTGNMAKLYFKVRNKLEGFGKAANPGTESPLDDGIKYLYFADNIPLISESKREGIESTDDLILLMRKGYIPTMSNEAGLPRCSMSRANNEINKYGTPYIKEHFSTSKTKEKGQETQYTNLCRMDYNPNYHKGKEPEPEQTRYSSATDYPPYNMYSFPGGCYLDPEDPRYDGNI